MWTDRGRRARLAIVVTAILGSTLLPSAFAQTPPAIDPQGAVDTVVAAVQKEWTGGITAHSYNCDENRPEVQKIVKGVKHSLAYIYPSISVMEARGYLPYADAPLFGLSGGQGHWINPGYIQDGHMMDPDRPESILVDKWNRPIGVMFIEDNPGIAGPDMYVSEDGVPCNGWHYHGEALADGYWYAYKYLYSGDVERGDLQPPDRTPDLMHVWAYGASACDHAGNFKYQFQHAEPPTQYMPGDPSTVDDVRGIVGAPRGPIDPPTADPATKMCGT